MVLIDLKLNYIYILNFFYENIKNPYSKLLIAYHFCIKIKWININLSENLLNIEKWKKNVKKKKISVISNIFDKNFSIIANISQWTKIKNLNIFFFNLLVIYIKWFDNA